MSNEGKQVKVHYTGTLDDGTKFDSSLDRGEPLAFTCMAGQMIKGFDEAVKNMEVGQTINVHIPAAEAYGEHNPEMVQTVPQKALNGSEQLSVGMTITLAGPDHRAFPATVVAKDEETITFDMNSPMAGKDLNFEITLLEAN